jgi:SAM-dependent methyltransferase
LNLSESIAKIGQPLTYRRAWRRARRLLHPVRIGPLLAKIDQERFRALRARCGSLPENAPPLWRHYAKYLELETWLRINIQRAQDLHLHRLPRQEILDIACGGGYFLFVARSLGHCGLGLDLVGIPVFDGLIDLLGVERRDYRVRPFEQLPNFGRQFDLITAFAPAFQGGRNDSWRWGPAEWDFFVSDLMRHLKPGARIFLDLNPAYGGNYYTPEILAVFHSHRGEVEKSRILFCHGN